MCRKASSTMRPIRKNLLFEVSTTESQAARGFRPLDRMDKFYLKHARTPKYFELLGPLLGRDIKQITHQIHWKPPGAHNYRFHQDAKFRNQAMRNLLYGAYRSSHRPADHRERTAHRSQKPSDGYLRLSEDRRWSEGKRPVTIWWVDSIGSIRAMEPGDLLLWTHTVRVCTNVSAYDRRFMISSYGAQAIVIAAGAFATAFHLWDPAKSASTKSCGKARPLLHRA